MSAWEEEAGTRELQEARARAAQMEKTMRWWSDCTANWRDKWSKVRAERNKAREEARLLRGKLDAATKECCTLKRERSELRAQLERLREDMNEHLEPPTTANATPEHIVPERDVAPDDNRLPPPEVSSTTSNEVADIRQANQINQDMQFLDKFLQRDGVEKRLSSRHLEFPVSELTDQKSLQLRLEEATKTIAAERQEKNKFTKSMEKLQSEYNQIRLKYDDLKKLKQDAIKELSEVRATHQDELDSIRLDLEDEASSRSSLEQRIAQLRTQLEQLQSENAAEWGRRERLETERSALERENKRLRAQVTELGERSANARPLAPAAADSDLRAELHDKNKELCDLKHVHSKTKKMLQEKSGDLAHASRRSEQYESEVKKLRTRIEELKKELAVSEDEVDSATNTIRKLQRTNDELQEQVESLQVQVEHLQTRLRSASSHALLTRHANSKLDAMSEEDY